MKYKVIASILIVSSFIGLTLFDVHINAVEPYFFELELVTNGGGVRAEYALLIAQQLKEIGIKVNVKVIEWTTFLGILLETYDFDMNIIGLAGSGGETPDMYDVYGQDGSLNFFGIDTTMPYGNESENMMIEGVTITDLEARQQHYYDWQQLMMDKIIPIVPLLTPRLYEATWANTNGYDARWGLVDCLPYIEYSGLHDGQVSLTEFNIANANWRDLNPLQTDDSSSALVFDLMDEPILGWNPDYFATNTSLVTSWVKIDDFHYKFTMRDDVYWNPSYNVTGRDDSSDPLASPATTPLMLGLKDGSFSDGTNQQVKAKDAVFTYLAWANPIVSEDPSYHSWISACYVDAVDDMSFHIEIDGNPATPELELEVDFWGSLAYDILPEFFLNSTDPTVTYSTGGAECTGLYSGILDTNEWTNYSTSAFGCGKYMLDYYITNSITVLQASPYWMGIGVKDGTVQDLDIPTFNIRVIPDSLAELAEFKAGKLDWMVIAAFPEERRLMQADPRFAIHSLLASSKVFLSFNLRCDKVGGINNNIYLTEPGKEEYTVGLAIRKAISYAINRVEINNEINFGEGFIDNSPIYPDNGFYYYNDVIKYDFDLDLAWEWMELAGFSKIDLLTGLTYTWYDDPVETTTVNGTVTVYETNVTTITLPADPMEPVEAGSVQPEDSTVIASFPIVPLLAVSGILAVAVVAKKFYRLKKK